MLGFCKQTFGAFYHCLTHGIQSFSPQNWLALFVGHGGSSISTYQHHNQKRVSFPNSLPRATERKVHKYTATKLSENKHLQYANYKDVIRALEDVILSRLVNDQKICPIGLVRRAGGDGKALRLDSLQSTVLAELIRKELRRLRDFEFQGHVHFTSTCSTGFLPVNFQAALGQMQPNTILTLPSNGGLIDINKYIYDTKSEYHCQTSMTPRCASKLTTK